MDGGLLFDETLVHRCERRHLVFDQCHQIVGLPGPSGPHCQHIVRDVATMC